MLCIQKEVIYGNSSSITYSHVKMLKISILVLRLWASQVTLIKNPTTNAGDNRDTGSIPGSGRCREIGNGHPCQYYCLGNSMYRGAWQAKVHKVTESDTTERVCAPACMQTHSHTLTCTLTHTHTRTHFVEVLINKGRCNIIA